MKNLKGTQLIFAGLSIIALSSALYFLTRGTEKSRIEK